MYCYVPFIFIHIIYIYTKLCLHICMSHTYIYMKVRLYYYARCIDVYTYLIFICVTFIYVTFKVCLYICMPHTYIYMNVRLYYYVICIAMCHVYIYMLFIYIQRHVYIYVCHTCVFIWISDTMLLHAMYYYVPCMLRIPFCVSSR